MSPHHSLLLVRSDGFHIVFVVCTHLWLIRLLVRTSMNSANLASFQAKELVVRPIPKALDILDFLKALRLVYGLSTLEFKGVDLRQV